MHNHAVMPPPKNRPLKSNQAVSEQILDNNNNKTSTNKRNRSASSPNLSSPETTQRSKMPATATDNEITLDKLISLFNNQKKEISSELNSNVNSIKDEIGAMVDKIKAEFRSEMDCMKGDVNALSESVDQRFAHINEQIAAHVFDEERLEDDYKRVSRANELKIVGVNYVANEKPQEIFQRIASLIGHNNNNTAILPTVIRIFKRQGGEQLPQKILIVKFIAPHLRDEFYSNYLSFLSGKNLLTGELIGTGGRDERITIGENLTPLNHKIFRECMNLKRSGNLFQVFTWDGITKVKTDKSSKSFAIKSQRELDLFMAKNLPNGNSNNGNGLAQSTNTETHQPITGTHQPITGTHQPIT